MSYNSILFTVLFVLSLGSFGVTDELICGENRCGFGTRTRCSGSNCRCRNNYDPLTTIYFTTDICIPLGCTNGESCEIGTTYNCTRNNQGCQCMDNYYKRTIEVPVLQICLKRCGECPPNYECRRTRCVCVEGYSRSYHTGECIDTDECLQDGICEEHNNTVCANIAGSFVCECSPGYNTSYYNTSCKDVGECEQKPSVCGEHSVCENHPGNYSCQCLEGFILSTEGNSTCLPVALAPSATSTDKAGVYVGVTFGVLALLVFVIVACLIFIRRRRKNNESVKETTRHSSDNTDGTVISGRGYEDNSLENTISEVSINQLVAQDIVGRDQESEGQGVYSVPYDEDVIFNNTQNKVRSMAEFPLPRKNNTTVMLDNPDACKFVDVNDKSKTDNQTNQEENYYRTILSYETANHTDSNAYSTLEADEGNISDDEQNIFNVKSAENSKLRDSKQYSVLETSSPNTTDEVNPSRFNVASDTIAVPNGSDGYCHLELKNGTEQDQSAYNNLRSTNTTTNCSDLEAYNTDTTTNCSDPDNNSTLDSCNLNTAENMIVLDTVGAGGNAYNTLYSV